MTNPRHVRRLTIVAPIIALLIPTAGRAQRADDLRVAVAASRTAAAAADSAVPKPVPGAPVLRSLSGLLGYAGGFYAGAYVGYQFRKKTGGDLDGLAEAFVGGAIGGAMGAAVGAALPKLGSRCEGDRRFGHAIGGAAIGSAVGLVGFALYRGWGGLVTVPVGSLVGATVGAHNCH